MPETRMRYFDDLAFIAGDVDPASRGVVRGQRWPSYVSLQLYLPTRAPLRFRVDDGPWHRFTTPTFYWHHPRHRYAYGPDGPPGAWHHHWVAFQGERGFRLIEQGFMPLSADGFCPAGPGALAGERFARLVACLERPAAHAEAVILLETLLAQAGEAAAPERGTRALVRDLIARIEAEPFAVWDLAAEARRIGISASQLRRHSLACCGRSPHDLLTDRRMLAAARLLASGGMPVAAVARRAGLSPGRFSRQFRTRIGLSPRAFRAGLPA
jgi:AraC-like DNA-binding protein